MARGKPWTDEEIKVLTELAEQGLSPQQIYDSGKLPGRTFQAIVKQLNALSSKVKTIPVAIVKTIEPASDVLSMDEIVKRFSTAFKQICELEEVDKLTLERFRIKSLEKKKLVCSDNSRSTVAQSRVEKLLAQRRGSEQFLQTMGLTQEKLLIRGVHNLSLLSVLFSYGSL